MALEQRIIKLDRRQAEFTQTFWSYLGRSVTDDRIEKGRMMLEKHHDLLYQIYVKYGVPPRYLVALWGLETNFGGYKGSFQVINSLITLAYDYRRSNFFRSQLLSHTHCASASASTGKYIILIINYSAVSGRGKVNEKNF